MYNLIACVNKKGLLGQENDLYSTSSKDVFIYFSQVTKGHNLKQNVVVMGYNGNLYLKNHYRIGII